MSEQSTSKDLSIDGITVEMAMRMADTADRAGYMKQSDKALIVLSHEVERLQNELDEAHDKMEDVALSASSHEPGAIPFASVVQGVNYEAIAENPPPEDTDHLQRFTEWLVKEMPSGTEIGDPRWWAPRILAAAIVTAPELPASPQPPGAGREHDIESFVAGARWARMAMVGGNHMNESLLDEDAAYFADTGGNIRCRSRATVTKEGEQGLLRRQTE